MQSFCQKLNPVAELAMFEPFLATVKLVVAAAPVPSFITTKSPALGLLGSVMVIDPANATRNWDDVAVVLPLTIVGAGKPEGSATEVQLPPTFFKTLPT